MIAQLKDVRLGFEDHGRGTPLLLLHGFPLDRSLWTHQRIALARRARCIVPDLRGFGESATDGPFSVDQYADDVVSLLDWLEVEQAVVGGLSMGGYVAMAICRRHPERVRGLVLCDTKATADTEAGRSARAEMIALAHAGGAHAIAEKMLPGMVGKSTRANRPEAIATLRAMMERQSVAGIVGALEAMRDRPDAQETLASVRVPTMVIVGEEDVLTPMSDAEAMMKLLPTSVGPVLEVIEGAGHASCFERPAAVTHALAEFLLHVTTERD